METPCLRITLQFDLKTRLPDENIHQTSEGAFSLFHVHVHSSVPTRERTDKSSLMHIDMGIRLLTFSLLNVIV